MGFLLIMGAICLAEFLVAFGVAYVTRKFFTTIVFVTLVNIAVCAPFLFYAVIFGAPAFVCSLFGAGLAHPFLRHVRPRITTMKQHSSLSVKRDCGTGAASPANRFRAAAPYLQRYAA